MTGDLADHPKHNGAMLLALASVLLALCACASAQPPRGVYAQFSPEGVTLYEAGSKILFYRMRPAEGAEPWRLHFIHPLYASSGQELTENAPSDHLHHRGAFTAWRRILLDGRQAGDAWVGKNLVWTVATPTFRRNLRGAGVLTTHAIWELVQESAPRPLIEESTQIKVEPLAGGARRIDIRSRYTALAENVAVAGTDDEKEYGGPSIRFAQPDRLELASGGRPLKAKLGPVETADEVEFRWRDPPAGWPRLIAASCSVDGRPWRRWVLRQELSMQNCAFPGRAPVTLPTKDALEIRLSLRIVE
jgi:hypothetical protein